MSSNIRLMLLGGRGKATHPTPQEGREEDGVSVNLWIALAAAVAVVVTLPIAAIILVSMASLREESAHSLSGEAPGPGERVARRLLGFRTDDIGAEAPDQRPTSASFSRTEVRLGH